MIVVISLDIGGSHCGITPHAIVVVVVVVVESGGLLSLFQPECHDCWLLQNVCKFQESAGVGKETEEQIWVCMKRVRRRSGNNSLAVEVLSLVL